MYLFEKIFQRNDRFFLQIYYLILGLLLNVGSFGAYYLRSHDWHMPDRISLRKNYKLLVDWYERVGSRPAVIKGYDCLNTGEQIPKI